VGLKGGSANLEVSPKISSFPSSTPDLPKLLHHLALYG